jgi:predicted phosphoribosyltransferase
MFVGMSSLVRELMVRGRVVGVLAQGGVALLPRLPELKKLVDRAERGLPPPPQVAGRTVVLVDDRGYCTQTAVVAVAALRELGAARVILAARPWLRRALHEIVDGVTDRPASPAAPTASAMSLRT